MERMNTGAQPAAKVASQPAGAAAPQSASQRPVVRLEHARKAFGGNQVLNDISLSVSPGEVVAIIGPSGGGKSTLLRCATMLEKMDGGELSFLGEKAAWEENGKCVYANKKQLKEIRKNFGLVFQNFNLFPHYTVMKNIIDAPVCVDGVSKEEAKERAWKLLKQLGLSDKADAYPYQLSGGQYRLPERLPCSQRFYFLTSRPRRLTRS